LAGQSHSALGTAKVTTAITAKARRVDQTAPKGRYTLGNVRPILEMRDRALVEAREQLPEPKRNFFTIRAKSPIKPMPILESGAVERNRTSTG
jgi:hypothetical protein